MIKLVQLNIEGDKHLDKIIPFLKKEDPDVLCLQEVNEVTFEVLKKELNMEGYFSLMAKEREKGFFFSKTVSFGVVILTKWPVIESWADYYHKFGGSTAIIDKDDKRKNFESLDHVLLSVKINKDHKVYTISTTHFPKNDTGTIVSPFQKKVFENFSKTLDEFSDIILTGDTNCPRGTELFDALALRYKDNIPKDVETTLDKNLHRAGFLPYVVDGLFSSSHYCVSNVRVIGGVSDHMAIVGEIEKI